MRTHTQIQDRKYQSPSEILADRLLDRMGFCGALQACRENHWHGVLELVRKKRYRPSER